MSANFKTYQATPETAGCIEALRQFNAFRESFLNSLQTIYGEEEGERMYQAEGPKLDTVQEAVSKHLLDSITRSFCTLSTPPNGI